MTHVPANRISGAFGAFVLQEIDHHEFTIYQHVFRMKMPVEIKVAPEYSIITLSYVLRGQVPCTLNGFGDALLSEGWYHLYYVPAGEHTARLPQGEAVVFQVNLHTGLLRELGVKYPSLQQVCDSLSDGSRNGLQQGAARITPRVQEVLGNIFTCSLDGAERDIYIRARIYDLLLLYLQDLNTVKISSRYHFSQHDILALHHASELLVQQVDQPPSQAALARAVHLHPRKLAEGFRMLYGMNMSEWLLQLRMQKARQLLRESAKPVSDVAYAVGYDTVSGFIRAFKGYAGCTPADYRK